MSRWAFPAAGAAALLAGTLSWLAFRPGGAPELTSPPSLAPQALYAASFRGPDGRAHTLGEFQGRILVLNFWATWCAPCREEMPALSRISRRWSSRGVQFLGLAADDAGKVTRFGSDLSIAYPLWTGGEDVGELSRRLGNRLGVLPHTVIVDANGGILRTKVGAYSEADLEHELELISAN